MAYQDFDLAGSARAGQLLVDPIARAVVDFGQRKQAEDEQSGYTTAIFNSALALRDAAGNPLVSDEEKQRFDAGNIRTRVGIAAGLMQRIHQAAQDKPRDPKEGVPQPLVLPDGSVLPGRFYVPGAHTVISTSPQPSDTRSSGYYPGQEVIPGWIWDGSRLRPKENQTQKAKADPMTRFAEIARQSEFDDLNHQIAAIKGELATGNARPGPDWLPWVTTPYADQLRQLEAKRDSLIAGRLMSDGGVPIETNPTGAKFYRDADGNPTPVPLAPGTRQVPQPLSPGVNQVPQPLPTVPLPPAAQPGGLADLARRALNDPTATQEHRNAAQRILGIDQSPGPSPTPTAGGKQTPAFPQIGEVRRGYRFKGGDPADKNNWEKQ